MKKTILLILLLTGIFTCFAKAVTLPVLLYHNITETEDFTDPDVHISKELFKEHLEFLKENNFNTITPREYYNYRVYGADIPENPIIITFDDGYVSNYELAYPLLRDYGFKATIFAVTNSSYSPLNFTIPHFTYEQAMEMEKSGVIEIESHSADHVVHSNLTGYNLLYQIRKSYLDIFINLGKISFAYAYPTGAFTEESKLMAENAGYKVQFTVQGKLNNDDTPLNEIKRMNIRGDCSVKELENLIYNSSF